MTREDASGNVTEGAGTIREQFLQSANPTLERQCPTGLCLNAPLPSRFFQQIRWPPLELGVLLRLQRPPRVTFRLGHTSRPYEILTCRVVVDEVERGIEQVRRKRGDVGGSALATHCGARGDALELLPCAYSIDQATQKHGKFRAAGSVIDVSLVDHDETPRARVLSLKQVNV
jgi:hypothetical protein